MEEKERVTAGKHDAKKEMKAITKEILGKSWDDATCDFAYDLVIESIKRNLLENGRFTIEGFCYFQIDWIDAAKKYDSVKNNGEFRFIEEHNVVRIHPTTTFKSEVRKLPMKFIVNKKKKDKE